MTGPRKSQLKRESKELFDVLSSLNEKQLQIISKKNLIENQIYLSLEDQKMLKNFQ